MLARISTCAVLLAAVCLLVFAPAYRAGITNWDDGAYLAASQQMTPFVMGNFHPLTMLSFAVTGRNPVVLHATNIALHAATAILLFLLLYDLTGALFPSFAAALLWAIHPLRVESVVWIAERKDVLCALFYVAGLRSYVRGRRALTYVFFILALLSKGMAVSFPLALVAIDYLRSESGGFAAAVRKKISFFALSVLFGVVGYIAQRSPGAVAELPGFAFSPFAKFLLSCRALLDYLGNLLLPIRLSAFYPYPKSLTFVDWLAPLFVLIIAVIAVWSTRVTRAIAFAFLFFAVTIAVVLPLVSIGRTMEADRYTYIPSMGLAYAIAVGLTRVPRSWPIVAAIAALLAVASFTRSKVWHDSVTLWTSVIELEPEVPLPYNSRAVALFERGDLQGAARDFDRALALDPCYQSALLNRALLAVRMGDNAARNRLLQQLRRCAPAAEH